MFKRILVPTDGSKLSKGAMKAALELAKDCGATVAVLNVQPPFTPPAVADIPVAMVYSPQEYDAAVEKSAKKILADAEKAAGELGVPVETYFVEDASPYEAIIRTAKKAKCDLIFMASHGRRGLSGLLLGSETHKVLTHCKIPVLVHR
jgi:nucleotide-binding universal stress UspA family protein